MFFTIHPFILPSSFWLVHLFSHFFRETSRYIRKYLYLCINQETNGIGKKYNDKASGMGEVGRGVSCRSARDMRLPFFDVDIVAGFPIPLDNDEKGQDIELLRMLCPNPEASYLIRVQGNSMIDAGIYDGDIIIVDKSNRNPSPTEVAVCELNGEYTLKRFERRGEEGWLVPANPSYPEIRVTEEDSFSIWGTVTYIIHKPRG